MKKRIMPLLMATCLMASTTSPVFGQEQVFDQIEDSMFVQEIEEPTKETVVSITIDGKKTDYENWTDALGKAITGNEILVKLNQDVDFTNADIYQKDTLHTRGINLEIVAKDKKSADITLDLNGHNVTNHYKNPNGEKYLAKGFTAEIKGGGKFKVINSSKTTSNLDVDLLGEVKSKYDGQSNKIIEFTFDENIASNTKNLTLSHVVSKYSDFYLGMNGGFKALQEDGSYNFYTSASEAIGNSKDKTAVLINNYTGDDNFAALSGVNGKIDLNGKTFTTKSTVFNLLYPNVELTIQNGTIHAMNDRCSDNGPNVGFIGDAAQEVSNIKLTLKDVNIESNYYRGIDLHGTDKNLHLILDHSTLTMTREDSYGIYMPAQESSVTLKNNTSVKAGTGIAVKGEH